MDFDFEGLQTERVVLALRCNGLLIGFLIFSKVSCLNFSGGLRAVCTRLFGFFFFNT